jgi:hypothetical protein
VDGFQGAEPDFVRDDWDSALQSICKEDISASVAHLPLGIKLRENPDGLPATLQQAQKILLGELYAFVEVNCPH